MGAKKKHTGYCTDLIGDLSLDWLKRRPRDKPFFLMSHHKAPHRNWQAGPKYAHLFDGQTIPEPSNLYDDYANRAEGARNARMRVGENMTPADVKGPLPADLHGNDLRKWAYQRYIKDYLRCVQSVDDGVGRHAGLPGRRRTWRKRYQSSFIPPTRASSWATTAGTTSASCMRRGLRMPFLMRYPREIRPGTVNRDMLLNLDFAETFLDYAGLPIPADMQGRSFRRAAAGHTPKDWRQSMYYRYWMHLDDHNVPAHYGVRTMRYKLVYYYGKPLDASGAVQKDTRPEWELFDLEKDPHEMNSVWGKPGYESVAKELERELARLQKQYGDQPR